MKRLRARRRGTTTYYFYDAGGKPRREIPLGTNYVEAVRKWAELEGDRTTAPEEVTFAHVVERYIREALPSKAPRTQRDNIIESRNLLRFFNDPPAPLDAIEPLHVRQYMKWRTDGGKTATVRANREKALLSHIWNFARNEGLTKLPNPCAGVHRFTESGRDIYVEDDALDAVRAASSVPLRDALDLAYLTGQRPADTLLMAETDLRDGMLHVGQGKTGKRLRLSLREKDGTLNGLGRLIEEIVERKKTLKVRSLALVCNEKGQRLTYSALDGRFERAREKAALRAEKAGNDALASSIRVFQFRDLRAKAGTDKTDSHSLDAARRQLGHSNVKMTEHYVRARKGDIVGPTK